MSNKIQNLLDRAAAQADSSVAETSSVASAERRFPDALQSGQSFDKFKLKLLQIRKWNAHSGLSSYELFDESGGGCQRETAKIGDFIRITLTGSGKSDWVKIIDIDVAPDEMILTVQPSYNPTMREPDKSVTSHFFTGESTNNFCLRKNGEIINIYVIGLNEKSNTEDTSGIIETVRNTATANLGHYLGIQKGEWTTFCKNFLETES